jgi:hypothetical protein
MAQACCTHANQHLAGAGIAQLHFLDGEGLRLGIGRLGAHGVEDCGADFQMIFSGTVDCVGAASAFRRAVSFMFSR